jgi:hypothetical protein
MTEDEKPVEKEEYLRKTVQAWVDSNPAEFKSNCKLLYRKMVFDRCRKYIGAPEEYLKTMLNTLPEFMKWYLSVFETVFMAGAFGVASAFAVIFVNNVITSSQQLAGWVFPFVLVLLIAVAALLPYRESRWLSYVIQHWFYVRHNINELNIEVYYISTILTIRKGKEKKI